AAAAWEMLGRPKRVRLVEMGPGDGTLMDDLLRAGRMAPEFLQACDVWLVEVSEPLKALQRARLGPGVRWAASLDEVPADAPLLIDYGRAEPGFGDTLQALKRHEKVDPLACPGEADLTVHADFPAVMAAARGAGAETAILTQAQFLANMGVGARTEALLRARP